MNFILVTKTNGDYVYKERVRSGDFWKVYDSDHKYEYFFPGSRPKKSIEEFIMTNIPSEDRKIEYISRDFYNRLVHKV